MTHAGHQKLPQNHDREGRMEPADIIYVNAGATRSADAWLGFPDQANNFLIARFNSLLGRNKFPVPMRRELPCKSLNLVMIPSQ